jgi:uncharacterized lipoprotein
MKTKAVWGIILVAIALLTVNVSSVSAQSHKKQRIEGARTAALEDAKTLLTGGTETTLTMPYDQAISSVAESLKRADMKFDAADIGTGQIYVVGRIDGGWKVDKVTITKIVLTKGDQNSTNVRVVVGKFEKNSLIQSTNNWNLKDTDAAAASKILEVLKGTPANAAEKQ